MRDVAWDAGFAALQQFQARTGHCRVPRDWHEGDYRLDQWLGVQRGLVAAGKLREGRRRVRLAAVRGASRAPVREQKAPR